MSILISLCHTTARTPDGWRDAAKEWLKHCDRPELVEHILTTDDPIDVDPVFSKTVVGVNEGPKTCVAGWNKAYSLSCGKLIISLADDWSPCPHWDTELLNLIPDLDDKYAVDVNTGGNEHLMCFVIATRAYLEQYNGGQGWMFYPEYDGMYCDNDFTDSARLAKVVIPARHLLFQHWHPAYMPSIPADEIHRKQARPEAYKIGSKVYKRRCKEKGLRIQPIIVVCLPGERFHSTWVAYWTTLLCYLSKHFTVSPNFTYSSNVYSTRACLAQQILNSYPLPDYVLWIDDDNLLSVEQFATMLEDLERTPEADMVAAWAWVQPDVYAGDNSQTSVGMFGSDGIGRRLSYSELMQGEYDLREIDYSGFPSVLMRGEMLEKAGDAAFRPIVDPSFDYGFAGEDLSFCIHAKQNGCRIFVDRRVRVPHLKLRDAIPVESDPARVFEKPVRELAATEAGREKRREQ